MTDNPIMTRHGPDGLVVSAWADGSVTRGVLATRVAHLDDPDAAKVLADLLAEFDVYFHGMVCRKFHRLWYGLGIRDLAGLRRVLRTLEMQPLSHAERATACLYAPRNQLPNRAGAQRL